ncbi:unnamed protein product [Phaedon cochleariae]|uniref:Uncharacterized protein n=1 Tax=Phaedon cochleariae TaxID=80249 RepID=A0A9N9WZQ1_PHACE|nr:unnamed protein product [Phaedon cochleariae]
MSDITSESSRDMIMDHPDIEELEMKRALKEKEALEKKLELKKQRAEERKKEEEMALKKRKEKAVKGMKYLLSISEKYSDFFREKIVENKPNPMKPLKELNNKLQPTVEDMKEAVDIRRGGSSSKIKGPTDVRKKLKYFEGGSLRDYQIEGVQWMYGLYENGINGILADEMGLGKTIQVIALIGHLLERGILGPYLIVAPLSTLPNWQSEFARFAPKIPVVLFHGYELERARQYKAIHKKYSIGSHQTLPVVLTSYQIPLLERTFMKRFQWQYVIVDEGHRVKNHETQLSQILRSLTSANRLLLTGTPLHNSITELWALLNFLMPHIFNNMDTFASLLMLEDVQDENKLLDQVEKTNIISTLHRVLDPFVLRRLKKEVLNDIVPKKEINIYCPLSKLQRDLYSYVIEKNITLLKGQVEEEPLDIWQPRKKRKCAKIRTYYENVEEDDFSDYEEEFLKNEEKMLNMKIERSQYPFVTRLTMHNSMMMFRKIVDHPYLVHFPLDPNCEKKALLVNENLVTSSGKMMVLDVMLSKLKKNGHKVLIFSTLCMTLDLIEEFMIMRDYNYRRLDGAIRLQERGEAINEFNNDPDILAFLVSTRAGGLGLNLTGADTVIFFDRDWNPQADIQAQDRCHRIGQTRPVMVYTLVTKNTIDEQVIDKGYQKRILEKLVIKDDHGAVAFVCSVIVHVI